MNSTAAIQEARAAKVAEARAMLQRAETEKRNLTQPEQAAFDKIKSEITDLEGQEQRAAFVAEAERRQVGEPVDKGRANLESQVSIVEAINSQIEGRSATGAVAEYSREVERRTGKRGLFVPLSAFETRAQTTTTATGIVPDDFRADLFVGPLRNSLVMRALGARILTGLRGDVVVPRQVSGHSAQWIAEGESLTESGMTFDSLKLQPRHVGSLTELSLQLLQQSSPQIEQLVRDDMSAVLAQAFDAAMLNGDGIKEPLGLLRTPGVQTASLATADWPGVLAMIEQLSTVNVTPNHWLASPQVATLLRTVLKSASAGSGYLMEGTSIAGIPATVTNQVTDAADAGTLVLGDFSEMFVGVWDSVQILTNPYADGPYRRGGVLVRALMTADSAVRRPEAFVVADDVAI